MTLRALLFGGTWALALATIIATILRLEAALRG